MQILPFHLITILHFANTLLVSETGVLGFVDAAAASVVVVVVVLLALAVLALAAESP